ncbi:MAG: S16 family serine protease, partial [Candidatus Aminicenantaceae bacterium]
RYGIIEVVLPLDNKPDLKDLPKKIREDMKIHFVENMDQVLEIALTEKYLEKINKEKAPITSELTEKEEEEGQQEPPVRH